MCIHCLQDLLEAVKPVLEEEQLQDALESLLMESSSYDAKILYNAMKVRYETWCHPLLTLLFIISLLQYVYFGRKGVIGSF